MISPGVGPKWCKLHFWFRERSEERIMVLPPRRVYYYYYFFFLSDSTFFQVDILIHHHPFYFVNCFYPVYSRERQRRRGNSEQPRRAIGRDRQTRFSRNFLRAYNFLFGAHYVHTYRLPRHTYIARNRIITETELSLFSDETRRPRVGARSRPKCGAN